MITKRTHYHLMLRGCEELKRASLTRDWDAVVEATRFFTRAMEASSLELTGARRDIEDLLERTKEQHQVFRHALRDLLGVCAGAQLCDTDVKRFQEWTDRYSTYFLEGTRQ